MPGCSASSCVFAFVIFPLTASEFAFKALLIPVLIYSLAALGLNILTGYAGQLSLGTGAFMGVGAYACYKLITIFPDLNPIVAIFLSGFFSAGDRRRLRPAVAAHQGLLPRHRDARRAVLSRLAVREMGMALQLQFVGRDPGADDRHVRRFPFSARTPRRSCNIMSCSAS